MAVNRLMPWNFEVANANALTQPIMAGFDAGMKDRQTAVENKRSEDLLAMQRERLGMEKTRAAREDKDAKISRWGREANAIMGLPEGQKQVTWQRWMQSNPDLAEHARASGVDLNDHVAGPQFIATEAGVYDADKKKLLQAQIEASQSSANLHNRQAGNVGKTNDINEFEFAKKSGYPGSFEDWRKDSEASKTKYGLNPIPYQKPDGSIGYMVPSTSGATKDLEIPGAGKAMPKVADVQTPTEVITRDQFGNIIRRERKDIAGKEAQEEVGKAAGKAQVDLPSVEANAESMLRAIDAVEKHPYLPNMTGWMGNLPNVRPEARDAQAKIDQIQGKAFLQQFNALRGGGAITEAEGSKATAAMSRLQETRVGTPEYKQALSDLRVEVGNLVALARRKAAGAAGSPPQIAPSPPAATGGWAIRRLD